MEGINFLELVDTFTAQEASLQKLYAKEGTSIRGNQLKYTKALTEAAKLVADVFQGKKPVRRLQEAMTTDDFPYLFGDILDRQLLANYRATPQVYRDFLKVGRVPDFRQVKRFGIDGAQGTLDQVHEQGEYPEAKLSESKYAFSVKKYGRRIPFSWESMINDDLDALKDIPQRFGKAASRTESKFATGLYVDANGPDATFYTDANGNLLSANPALSIAGLQQAIEKILSFTDSDGEPIAVDMFHLVVPPALSITARNILNATQIDVNEKGGTTSQRLRVNNWMTANIKLHVESYIPIVANTTNGNSSWFLFADPSSNRPAAEVAFLTGHESPEIFIKKPDAQRVGGGNVDPMAGDFDNDSINYKVRHVFGGGKQDPKATVASNGSGAKG